VGVNVLESFRPSFGSPLFTPGGVLFDISQIYKTVMLSRFYIQICIVNWRPSREMGQSVDYERPFFRCVIASQTGGEAPEKLPRSRLWRARKDFRKGASPFDPPPSRK